MVPPHPPPRNDHWPKLLQMEIIIDIPPKARFCNRTAYDITLYYFISD